MEVYVSLAFLSALSLTSLGFLLYRIDRSKEFFLFLPVMGAAAVWALFSGLWLIIPVGLSTLMNKFSFLGIITLPVFLFLFAMDFSGKTWIFRRRVLPLFWVIPAVSILLMLTNEMHGLFWSEEFTATLFQDTLVSQFTPGTWYYVHSVYSYGLIFVSLGVLWAALRKQNAILWQYALLLGISLPLITSILFIFNLTPLDFSPLVLSITVLGFGWFISIGFYERNIRELQFLQKQTDGMNQLYNLIVRVSDRLIHTNTLDMDEAISDVLAELGEFTGVDRAYVFEFDWDSDQVSNTFEWCQQGISPEMDNLQEIPVSAISRWIGLFADNKYVYIPSVADLPDDEIHQQEKELLLAQDIKSLIVVPMYQASELSGFVGFDSVKKYKMWDRKSITLLGMTANIIAGSIIRKEYEQALIKEKQNAEAANRTKTEFLGNMSHELRTPLNAILGFTDLVSSSLTDETLRRQLQMVSNSGQALMRLLNDLLDFSKAEAGVLKMEPVHADVEKLLDFVRDVFLPEAEEKDLDLRVRYNKKGKRYFLFDEGRLRQVLFNIVGNGIKFTHEGYVEVTLDVEPFGDNASAAGRGDLPDGPAQASSPSSSASSGPSPTPPPSDPSSPPPSHRSSLPLSDPSSPPSSSHQSSLPLSDPSSPPSPSNWSYMLVFTIKDTGIGIPESDQKTIFSAFTQLSTGNARVYEGTGLGLNISQRLVHLMGGEIELESTPGEGSVFTVKIPCE